MGKGRPRAVEKGVLGLGCGGAVSPSISVTASLSIPPAPVFYPTEDEFKDPLEFIYKIRPLAEPYGICRIVPPKSWNPPFARDLESFTFPTKTQAIHRLQARPPSCDSATFELEYSRFFERHFGKKTKKKLIFNDAELDLCRLFNAVKRYGGYEKVCDQKRWGDVTRFMLPGGKVSECSKHVLCQLYRENLFDYEEYLCKLNIKNRKCRRGREHIVSHEKVRTSNKKRKWMDSFREMREMGEGASDQICEQCRSGLHGDVMLLCDRCDKGWHLYCLSPPLESVPSGNWYCLECVNSDKDSFGFVPGKRCSLEAFKRMNDRIRKKYFGQTSATRVQMEKQFWEIVEGKAGELEVMYGSDLDTSVHGSGFPRLGDPVAPKVEADMWKKYISSPWNLNNLPKLKGSMLRVVHDNIAGVMVPWLYVGMLFSSFCWHVEDHCFYSINYLHWGEPKCWYGVPGREAGAFEQAMRNTLPDLFDAQPDLLFQLVTMLNPSILQESSISVYSVTQEPGNFVITFPKSFHGGFNFGLNCAEAVNFAPADWLSHGGFGADLYRLYRRAAVFSHEELLCVVTKNACDSKALPYLKEELCRVFSSEKISREELWVNGIIRSSLMAPKKQPMYVCAEEDNTCIICRQYLYLSAISCSCRPTTFVCLKHWKHLCECDASQLCLLYRYSLAELDDLISAIPSMSHVACFHENLPSVNSQQHASPKVSMIKKAKSGHVTFAQVTETWLVNAHNLFEIPFSNNAYAAILNETEQFLWAGHDVDSVRSVAGKLSDAQKWALSVRDCILQVENYLHSRDSIVDKVSLSQIKELLSADPLPCNEPALVKLEVYTDDAKRLIGEIRTGLSSSLVIGELEMLLSKAMEFPVDIEETKMLAAEISSAKIWISNVRQILFEEMCSSIDIDLLNRLKSEMAELQVQIPEMELLAELSREVDLLQFRCKEILKCPLKLKELDSFLKDADKVRVSFPELVLLRQFHSDACSWYDNFHVVMDNLYGREDYESIVTELSSIVNAGKSLRIEVDELQLAEAELERSYCRVKAVKALRVLIPLEFIRDILMEASLLEIKNERLFVKLSTIDAEATLWERRANFALSKSGSMLEFEDILRDSEHLNAILPSLCDVKDAISTAQSWVLRSRTYLIRHAEGVSSPLPDIEDLKELVALSKSLKISLHEPERLRSMLDDIYGWEQNTCSLLEDTTSLLESDSSYFRTVDHLILRIEELLSRINSATKIGMSMCVTLSELPKLQHASLALQWSLDALSFCSRIPLAKDVDDLFEDAHQLPTMFLGCNLVHLLLNGSSWLRKALIAFPMPQNAKRCKLEEVEEILGEIQKSFVLYPVMVAHLQKAIEKHKAWALKVYDFFTMPNNKCWASLLELEEEGHSNAFDCQELANVDHEVGRVKRWMLQCHGFAEPLVGNLGTLSTELIKIRDSLHRALCIYRASSGYRTAAFHVCCLNDSESELAYICPTCEDRYHFSCMGPSLAIACMKDHNSCPICCCMEKGIIPQSGEKNSIFRENRTELKSFTELLSSVEDFYPGIEELTLVHEIVKLAKECQSNLSHIINHVNSHYSKDLSTVSGSLKCALKATAVAGLYDYEGGQNLQDALFRHSWKVRVNMSLFGAKKPSLQLIQCLEKEGLELGVRYEDYFMMEIKEIKKTSLRWADMAKEVASDSGKVMLNQVFDLINEGENLPVQLDEEMKLLRTRSILYCICRKPDDQRPMIACDQCDEWYHFDCINLRETPLKTFFCPACKPHNGDLMSLPGSECHEERSKRGEPQTPACHESKRRQQPKTSGSCLEEKNVDFVDNGNFLDCCSEIDHFWRLKKRPLQRASRKHSKLENLSQLLPFSTCN